MAAQVIRGSNSWGYQDHCLMIPKKTVKDVVPEGIERSQRFIKVMFSVPSTLEGEHIKKE
tara:strand:+ start:663 stop:842 length:180 start_codon:yes stop_codon:yes gene_type:complete